MKKINNFYCENKSIFEKIKEKYVANQAESRNSEGDSSNSIFVEEMMREQNPIRVKESSRKLFTDKERSNVSQ